MIGSERRQPAGSGLWRRLARAWSRGGLSPRQLAKEIFSCSIEHQLVDRSALLAFYFLVAFFPLLLVGSTLVGFILSAETSAYWRLASHLEQIMPRSASEMVNQLLRQIATGASGGKLSLGLLLALWTASSGTTALIESLNVAFETPVTRTWWRRRVVALGLTLGVGLLFVSALGMLFAGNAVLAAIVHRLPVLSGLPNLSNAVRWFSGLFLLFSSLTLIYGLGPNLNRRRWEGILPGAIFALLSWLVASVALRAYLFSFGYLDESYGSLAGVIAFLFWLYVSGAAILLGGELNAAIWRASGGHA